MFNIKSGEFENSPLAEIYYNCRSEGYSHRVSLWAAWESHKSAAVEGGGDLLKLVNLPRTQKDFADLIGVSSRTIRKYKTEHAALLETCRTTAFNRLLGRYRLPALHALGQSAATPDPKHASDRRIFFTMTGDLVDRQDITSGDEPIMITVDR